MRILLLGYKGQLGNEFFKILGSQKNIELTALDIADLDVTNRQDLLKIVNQKAYDVILNCTAYNNVDMAEENPELAYKVNYYAIRNLTDAANVNQSLLVHYSTDYVFSGQGRLKRMVYDERKPISKYGKSKKYGEDLLRELTDKYLLIRTSWLFGETQDSFVVKLINWSKETKEIELIQDQISSPTYAYDLAIATLNLIKAEVHGTFHVTNTPVSKLEWGKYILNKISWDGQIHGVNMSSLNLKAKRPKYSVLDNSDYKIVCNEDLPSWKDATDRFLDQILEVK